MMLKWLVPFVAVLAFVAGCGWVKPAPVPPRPTPTHSTPTPTSNPPSPIPSPTGGAPAGPAGPWTLRFADDFNGTGVDGSKWGYQSSAESDWSTSPAGTGNPGNQQLEFDQSANCSVANGALVVTAKQQAVTSSSGHAYAWTSCMLTSSYAFQYGYMEERALMPAVKGFWPAFWTWAAPGQNIGGNGETDVYEVYTDNQFRVYQTQHNTGGGGGSFTFPAGPGVAAWHTYGVDVEPSGTTWYVDGAATNHASATSGGLTNILIDDFVYSQIPPAAASTGVLLVDYVRAWQH